MVYYLFETGSAKYLKKHEGGVIFTSNRDEATPFEETTTSFYKALTDIGYTSRGTIVPHNEKGRYHHGVDMEPPVEISKQAYVVWNSSRTEGYITTNFLAAYTALTGRAHPESDELGVAATALDFYETVFDEDSAEEQGCKIEVIDWPGSTPIDVPKPLGLDEGDDGVEYV